MHLLQLLSLEYESWLIHVSGPITSHDRLELKAMVVRVFQWMQQEISSSKCLRGALIILQITDETGSS